jgi:EAL domain-containing protein (putative c-di-GMP-specific phosphodiesterase class I)
MKMIEDENMYNTANEIGIDLMQGRYLDNKHFTGVRN